MARNSKIELRLTSIGYCLLFVGLFCLLSSQSFGRPINWWLFHGTLGYESGFEYTDNLDNNTAYTENVYWFHRPVIEGGIELPIPIQIQSSATGSEADTLTINTGVSYDVKYSASGNKRQDGFSSPVSADLRIPFSIGNWKILVTDGFSFKNNNLEAAVQVNEESIEQYQNLAAINVTRNYGAMVISMSAQRTDDWSPGNPDLENTVQQVTFTPGILIRNTYTLFWQNSYAWVHQVSRSLQDSEGYASSIGVSGQLAPTLNGTVSLGYSHSTLKQKVTGPGDGIFGGIFDPKIIEKDNVDGVTSILALNYAHPVNPNTAYTLSLYYTPGVTAVLKNSSLNTTYGVVVSIAHRLTKTVTLEPVFRWTHSEAVGRSSSGEVTDVFGVTFGLNREFTQHIRGRINYSYLNRLSNLDLGSYDVNLVTLALTYYF